jgi:hypothetical protein
VTDSQGRYRFDNFNGIEGTGTYTVRLVVPSGFVQTSADPAEVSISRGDIDVSGVDFSLAPVSDGVLALDPGIIDALLSEKTGAWTALDRS